MRYLIFILIVLFSFTLNGQDLEVSYANIGDKAASNNGKITITLKHRFQHYKPNTTHANDHYDKTIFSPKSVLILDKKNKFYINNLEGYSTSVYNLNTFKLEKVIKHIFQADDSELFDDTTAFDYQFTTNSHGFNIFKGKPVEGCVSHGGKYLWVTY